MYAIIESGGKQHKVAIGDKLKVEKLLANAGEAVNIERVLMVADGDTITVGAPVVESSVRATVLGHGKGDKIKVFKMKRRKNYRRTQGHRQDYTEIKIISIGEHIIEDEIEVTGTSVVLISEQHETMAADVSETDSILQESEVKDTPLDREESDTVTVRD